LTAPAPSKTGLARTARYRPPIALWTPFLAVDKLFQDAPPTPPRKSSLLRFCSCTLFTSSFCQFNSNLFYLCISKSATAIVAARLSSPSAHLVPLHTKLRSAIMPAKSRFTRLDAFTKTVDEARVRTTSGGIVTIASLLIVLYLAFGEWRDYRLVVVHPELIVDKGRGKII
jgi:hypothetical protein